MNNNKICKDEDIIYYNVIINGIENNQKAEYEDTRTTPIIQNPCDYYMSVIRYSLDTQDVPLFVCPVIPNPADPTDLNFCPMRIGFIANIGGIQIPFLKNLIFTSQNEPNGVQPPSPQTGQDVQSRYYHVYSIDVMIGMINDALDDAFEDLKTNRPEYNLVPTPYVIWDPEAKLISIIVSANEILFGTDIFLTHTDQNGRPVTNPASIPDGKIQIYLNFEMLGYLDSFRYQIQKNQIIKDLVNNPDSTTSVFLLVVRDKKDNYFYPPQNNSPFLPSTQTLTSVSVPNGANTESYTVQPKFYKITQEYPNIANWNNIQSIVFLTGKLPIQSEYIPSITFNNKTNSYTGNSFRPILTDFVADYDQLGKQRERVIYSPSSYRYISMTSTEPLREIDIKIFWQDRLQNLYPLEIPLNNSISVKIMFIKKSLVKLNSATYP